ncbi:unnamed protein product [Wuchereria bancrofti]|uniref:Uncharacterized protein n=1 Tax=Wuchereria bancrofti TaxID=6293 RepID=A0A3P7GCP3_WUCBA|nr:unnamed protein product [Wuchereria bancrofti]
MITQQLSSKHLISQNKAVKVLLENNADSQNKPKSNVMETGLGKIPTNKPHLNWKCLALSGRMTPVEMLNSFGLERSLTAAYSDNRSILELLPGTISPIGNSKFLKSNGLIDCEKVERHVFYIIIH